VPRQYNGCDCGVFACRYTYGIYQLACSKQITYEISDGKFITDSNEFKFNGNDIDRIRMEMKTLIQRLTHVYTPWKKLQVETETAAKLAAKTAKASRKRKTLANAATSADTDQTPLIQPITEPSIKETLLDSSPSASSSKLPMEGVGGVSTRPPLRKSTRLVTTRPSQNAVPTVTGSSGTKRKAIE
jgi:hypothetical protein